MKKITACLIVLFFMMQYGFAGTVDSTTDQKINTIISKTDSLQNSVNTIKTDVEVLKTDSTKKCNCIPIKDGKVQGCGEWFIILSPFYLLILVVLIVAIRLRYFKFTEALTENESPKKTIKNPEYSAAGIAANASVPNVSILFPPTIEISNLQPSISELKQIVASKESAVAAIQISLDNANANTSTLNQTVVNAKKEFDDASGNTANLTQDVASAQTQLDTLKGAAIPDAAAISTAQKSLEDAQKLVTENTAAVATAQKHLEDAQKLATENTTSITKFTDLLSKTTAEVEIAKKNVETAEEDEKNNTACSINTYRPSISRYIAFITSLITVILVVCMSSFFIYHYMKTGCPPDFGALTVVLIALGLGVTPYITNKISTAATANKS